MTEPVIQHSKAKVVALPAFVNAQIYESVASEKIFAKRLLRSNSGHAYIRHAGKLWDLGLGAYDEILVRVSTDPVECELSPSPEGFQYALSYFVAPADVICELTNSAWRFDVNSCYIALSIRTPIEILEALVNRLLSRKINIVSWDEVDADNGEYPYLVRFSKGLALDRIRGAVADFFENEAKDIQLRLLKTEMERLSDLSPAVVANSRFDAPNEFPADDTKQYASDALELAFLEISDLEEKVAEQQELITSLKVQETSEFRKLKRSELDKMLGYLLVALFPNIALSPESVSVLKERFVKSKSIWRLLGQLNQNENIMFKSLHGLASKAGWKEVQEHIGTGKDSRGRLYFRRSKHEHFYDVVLHWKKNDVEQDRVITKLATYEYFESPQVVL
jgi:hypothetical protein